MRPIDQAIDIRRRARRRLHDPEAAPDPEADELLKDYEDWAVRSLVWCARVAILAAMVGVVWLAWWAVR